MSTVEARSETAFLEYCFTVGVTLMEGRGFYVPIDTAIGQNGRLYVVNRAQQSVTRGVRVTICDIEGEFFGSMGSFGQGDGQFVSPSGGAVDSRGRVYISDEHLHRISVFNSSGQFLSKWGTPGHREGELDTPSGIAFDSQDNLYVADTYNHRIQKFTADGRFLLSFGSKLGANGSLRLPWGITAGPNGEVYVADWGNDRIQRFSCDGEYLTTYGASGNGNGEFHRPSSVAVDKDGFIYVADWGNERVQVLDAGGRFIANVRGQATVSRWAENFLNVNVEEAKARSRANLEMDINYFVADPHEESSHIEKYLWAPASVKLDSAGMIYVTESNRHRIQVFKRRGE